MTLDEIIWVLNILIRVMPEKKPEEIVTNEEWDRMMKLIDRFQKGEP